MAVKLLNVPGERAPESPSGNNQDRVLEAGETAFINANAKDFLLNLTAGVANAPSLQKDVKGAVSNAARAANAALEAVGGGSKMLGFFGHPSVHPLSETYFSQAPLRWAITSPRSVSFSPTRLDRAGLQEVDASDDPDAFRHAVIRHFADAGATFELRVQLATDLDVMPIENASKRWSEKDSSYRPVARLVLPPQAAWTEARAAYVDERVSLSQPVQSHRPLGQIMQARMCLQSAGRISSE